MGNFDKYQLTLNKQGEDDLDFDGDVATAPVEPKLKRPSMYNVVMLNDDYTPMDYVVEVLQIFFNLNIEASTQIMLRIHTEGKAVCGRYSRDVAETKATQVNEYSQESGHPLVCEIEAASDD